MKYVRLWAFQMSDKTIGWSFLDGYPPYGMNRTDVKVKVSESLSYVVRMNDTDYSSVSVALFVYEAVKNGFVSTYRLPSNSRDLTENEDRAWRQLARED